MVYSVNGSSSFDCVTLSFSGSARTCTAELLQVIYDGQTSRVTRVVCAVPQGSVLGPRLFVIYTAELADKADEHGVKHHAFADDTQWYVHCRREDAPSARIRLQRAEICPLSAAINRSL